MCLSRTLSAIFSVTIMPVAVAMQDYCIEELMKVKCTITVTIPVMVKKIKTTFIIVVYIITQALVVAKRRENNG